MQDVTIELEDHYTGAEINGAVNGGDGFSEAFPGETAGDLEALRRLFQRKALVARQSRLLVGTRRRRSASSPGPTRSAAARCAGRSGSTRRDGAPPFVTGDGTPVAASDVRFRRMSSLTALSLETNGGICRDLLKNRYGEEVAA